MQAVAMRAGRQGPDANSRPWCAADWPSRSRARFPWRYPCETGLTWDFRAFGTAKSEHAAISNLSIVADCCSDAIRLRQTDLSNSTPTLAQGSRSPTGHAGRGRTGGSSPTTKGCTGRDPETVAKAADATPEASRAPHLARKKSEQRKLQDVQG